MKYPNTVIVRLTDEEIALLDAECARQDRPRSWVLRAAVQDMTGPPVGIAAGAPAGRAAAAGARSRPARTRSPVEQPQPPTEAPPPAPTSSAGPSAGILRVSSPAGPWVEARREPQRSDYPNGQGGTLRYAAAHRAWDNGG